MTLNKHLLALAAASLFASAWAAGPDSTTTAPTIRTPVMPTPAPVARDSVSTGEKERLQQALQGAAARADYAKVLESNGYRISAINTDKPDYLEYEVVKGDKTYEVQLNFDKGAAKATKVDVASNLWRADATKQMQKDPKYKNSAALTADPLARYSDRRYMKTWNDEKGMLEKAMPPNQSVSAYKTKLQQMGYQITAVNDREADHVEYEILKGDNSYEVQIDLDPKTKLGKQVDVTSNLWDAEGTERAKDANKVSSK